MIHSGSSLGLSLKERGPSGCCEFLILPCPWPVGGPLLAQRGKVVGNGVLPARHFGRQALTLVGGGAGQSRTDRVPGHCGDCPGVAAAERRARLQELRSGSGDGPLLRSGHSGGRPTTNLRLSRTALWWTGCESLDWSNPDGGLNLISVPVAPPRMQRDGLLILPPPLRPALPSRSALAVSLAAPPRCASRRSVPETPAAGSGMSAPGVATPSATTPCPGLGALLRARGRRPTAGLLGFVTAGCLTLH